MSALVQISNPFRSSILTDAWRGSEVTVPQIHADVFDDCLQAIEQVAADRRSTSLLIHGEAGSGKTHLLSRLRAHLCDGPRQGAAFVEQRAVCVWVRLQTSPRMIWRHVRRWFVDDLLRAGPDRPAQFHGLLLRRLAELRTADGDLELWWNWILEEASHELEALLDQLGDAAELERDVATVVKHLALRRHLRDAKCWLRGEALPESALARLDLPPADDDEHDQEQRARQVVLALCRLAGDRTPVVFGFDQVEALQLHPDDMTGLFAFGQMIATLHDEARNLALISCVQSSFATLLSDRVRGADYARMAEFSKRSLAPLSWEEAAALIQARLDASPALAALRAGRTDRFWPLAEDELRGVVLPHGCTPRRLLAFAAERFAAIQNDRKLAAPSTIEAALAQLWEQRQDDALTENEACHSEAILAQGLPALLHAAGTDWKLADDSLLPDVHLVFDTPVGRIGISLCTHVNMASLANMLRRLQEQLALRRLHRLVLLRDSRTPLSRGAKKTRERLAELTRAGAVLIHPAVPALAALDALSSLLSDAKSGDLSSGGTTIAPSQLHDWLGAELPASLRDLIDALAAAAVRTPPPADPEIRTDLLRLLAGRNLISLNEAAMLLHRSVDDLAAAACNSPEQFGLLTGPPQVVFQYVLEPARERLTG